jgi:class 3 adenylate cyclase
VFKEVLMDALHDALAALGLGQHSDAFRAADIDLEVLPLLGEADLKELGLTLGQRRKLLAAISAGRLKPPSAEAPRPGGTPATDPEQLRQLTVLVCDLVGSTEMMQRLDPEAMGEVVREFQELAASVITRFEGFVERFAGDSVVAFFGYPHAHEDAAERAVRAGLAIIEALRGVRVPGGGLLTSRTAVASGGAYFGERVERAGTQEAIVIADARQPAQALDRDLALRLTAGGNLIRTIGTA